MCICSRTVGVPGSLIENLVKETSGVWAYQDVIFCDGKEGIIRLRAGKEHVFGVGSLGQITTRRDMVGVQVGVDHLTDRHTLFLRLLQVRAMSPMGSTTAPIPLVGHSRR